MNTIHIFDAFLLGQPNPQVRPTTQLGIISRGQHLSQEKVLVFFQIERPLGSESCCVPRSPNDKKHALFYQARLSKIDQRRVVQKLVPPLFPLK